MATSALPCAERCEVVIRPGAIRDNRNPMMRRFAVMRRGYLDIADPVPVGTGVEWLADGFVTVRWAVPRRSIGLFDSLADLETVYGQTFEIAWLDFKSADSATTPDDQPALPAGSVWEGHDDPQYPRSLMTTGRCRS